MFLSSWCSLRVDLSLPLTGRAHSCSSGQMSPTLNLQSFKILTRLCKVCHWSYGLWCCSVMSQGDGRTCPVKPTSWHSAIILSPRSEDCVAVNNQLDAAPARFMNVTILGSSPCRPQHSLLYWNSSLTKKWKKSPAASPWAPSFTELGIYVSFLPGSYKEHIYKANTIFSSTFNWCSHLPLPRCFISFCPDLMPS